MPPDLTVITKVTVLCRSLTAETHGMVAYINIVSGADNEPYNTNSTTWDSNQSDTTNFAVNDIVFWECVAGNKTAGDALSVHTAGDRLRIYVNSRNDVGDDVHTDGYFGAWMIEYE